MTMIIDLTNVKPADFGKAIQAAVDTVTAQALDNVLRGEK